MARIVEVPDEFVRAAWDAMAGGIGGSAAAATVFAAHNVPTPDQIAAAPEGTYRWQPPSRTSIPLTLIGAVALAMIYLAVTRPGT